MSNPTAYADLLDSLDLPSSQLEEWRYSRVDELDLGAYGPVEAPAADAPLPAGLLADRDLVGERAATVVVRNGRVVAVDLDERLAARGVRIGRLAEMPELGGLRGTALAEPDAFVTLSDALAVDPVVVDVPAGVELEAPVVIARWLDAEGAATFPRLVVRAGPDAGVEVVETSGSADVDALVVPVTEVLVERAARVRVTSLQRLGPRVVQVGRQAAVVDQEATLRLGHVALGGARARLRFDCRLAGRGATGEIAALYHGHEDQLHDLRTFQDHDAPDTVSDLTFKGVVDDRAHAVYTGLIRISKDGRGSNATQSNRIVKLSPDAWAESVPNLEILHNDVRCSHASTVGPIDEDQRFYLESRGVPPAAAERLVVGGFFTDVLAALARPELAAAAAATIRARLEDPR